MVLLDPRLSFPFRDRIFRKFDRAKTKKATEVSLGGLDIDLKKNELSLHQGRPTFRPYRALGVL